MDLQARLSTWWSGLDDEQRAEAKLITDDIPPWLSTSLLDADLLTVPAELTGHSPVLLMPHLCPRIHRASAVAPWVSSVSGAAVGATRPRARFRTDCRSDQSC